MVFLHDSFKDSNSCVGICRNRERTTQQQTYVMNTSQETGAPVVYLDWVIIRWIQVFYAIILFDNASMMMSRFPQKGLWTDEKKVVLSLLRRYLENDVVDDCAVFECRYRNRKAHKLLEYSTYFCRSHCAWRFFFSVLFPVLPKEWQEILQESAIEKDMVAEQLPAVIDVLQYVFQEKLGDDTSMQSAGDVNPEESRCCCCHLV